MTHTAQQLIVMGSRYRDEETGFEGVATGVAHYLVGTSMAHLENSEHDRWIEADRLTKIEEGS